MTWGISDEEKVSSFLVSIIKYLISERFLFDVLKATQMANYFEQHCGKLQFV